MKLHLIRFNNGENDSLGLFFVDNVFESFTLEDEERLIKVKGKTRIKEGEYEIILRTEGGLHQDYSKLFPEMHKGMLWIKNVPDFEYIYLHIGNDHLDTEGCPLLGNTCKSNKKGLGNGFIGESSKAYKAVYPKIAGALLKGEKVMIKIVDSMTLPEFTRYSFKKEK